MRGAVHRICPVGALTSGTYIALNRYKKTAPPRWHLIRSPSNRRVIQMGSGWLRRGKRTKNTGGREGGEGGKGGEGGELLRARRERGDG